MKFSKEDKSGLYLTAIIHLAVLIVLLISQIGTSVKGEFSYLLDFSDMEQKEMEAREAEFKESISDRLDDLLAAAPQTGTGNSEMIRNVAVDAGTAPLKDDRNTDASQLYRDAARLDEELRSGAFAEENGNEDDFAALTENEAKQDESRTEVYKGPAVVSYSLDGRKALTLSIPAYRCPGGGDVTVRICVNRSGRVNDVKIVEEVSSADRCLRDYAKRAARLSRFTASGTAPEKQYGEIVYRFIAQ